MASRLEDYLNYYKTTKAPGYAVLVTGDWGVGKTFQVQRCLKADERYYISLFGLQSTSEVHAAVLAEIDPTLSGAKKILGSIEEKAAQAGHWVAALGSLSAATINAVLHRDLKIERTIIFDDLERSSLDTKDVLGVINSYLEHRDARVVVLAHDEKVADQFTEMKEKLFGQTIRIEPLISEAFNKFTTELTCDAQREFAEEYREQIISTFTHSRIKSLRILRHVVEDFGRLHDALAPEHRKHHRAMSELVPLFCALDAEVRAGGISATDIGNRHMARDRYLLKKRQAERNSEEVETPALVAANEKYTGIDLESSLLTNQALIEMFFEGRYRSETIRDAMNASHFFIKPAEVPPWMVVMKFEELPDRDVNCAAEKMERQFKNREITEPGEMLHVFALRMMMAENGIRDQKLNEVTTECINYIDDLLAAERLPPASPQGRLHNGSYESHAGYVYWVSKEITDYFVRVRQHLVEASNEAFKQQFPKFAAQLLKYVRTNGQKFLEHVCQDGQYARIPVLAHIKPEKFVAAWFDSPIENWRFISLALTSRYELGALDRELAKERDWILKVLDLVEDAADKAEGFRAFRMQRVIHPNLRALGEKKADT